MRLYFIRHGQSQNNALYQRTGSDLGRVDDPELTDIGAEQAARTAEFLSTQDDPVGDPAGNCFGITHLYTSLMSRSMATSAILGKKVGIRPIAWKDWHENGGIYYEDRANNTFIARPGMTAKEIEAIYPDVIFDAEGMEQGWWNRSVEERDERPVRARRVLRELMQRHGGTSDRVVVVSHGGFFMHFLAAVMGVDEIIPVWFRLYNCAITRFDFNHDEQVVVYHNSTGHLGRSLLT